MSKKQIKKDAEWTEWYCWCSGTEKWKWSEVKRMYVRNYINNICKRHVEKFLEPIYVKDMWNKIRWSEVKSRYNEHK